LNIDGGCHCGDISYEAKIDSDKVTVCHCTDCQVLSGSAFRTIVFASEVDFKLTTGKLSTYIKISESGNKREQTFCPNCGTPIYATSVGSELRVLGIRLGTVNQRKMLKPTQQIWCHSMQDWVKDLDSISMLKKQ